MVEGGIKRQEAAGGRELEEENWRKGNGGRDLSRTGPGGRELEAWEGGRELEEEELEAGNWRKRTGGRELEEDENWRQGAGGKKLAAGNWREVSGGREIEVKSVEVMAFFPESLSYSRVSSK